jgi:PAS domain
LDQSIEKIRGINQRALAINWTRMAGDHKIPRFEDFDPGARIHDPKKLAVWNVEQCNGQIVLRALFSGKLLNEPISGSWSGKTLEELTPLPLRSDIVSGAHECVRTACAIYMILRIRDAMGHAIDLERLLLPFGRDGQVEQIVASRYG